MREEPPREHEHDTALASDMDGTRQHKKKYNILKGFVAIKEAWWACKYHVTASACVLYETVL